MGKKVWLTVVLALVLIGGTACAKVPSPDKGIGSEDTRKEQGEKREPFTGVPLVEKHRPAVMVMINNHHAARPQTGLSMADMVIEALAEGEITRFAAFYHSEMKGTVGPVRSVRPYFLDLSRGSRAVVAHAGGSKAALREIKEENIQSLDGIHGGARLFQRVSFRKAPHNLYTNLEKLLVGAKEKASKQTNEIVSPYHFNNNGSTGKGKPANKVHLSYHKLYDAGYQYDEESGRYVRFTQGIKQVDRETEAPLTMDNVWVIKASQRVIDSAGHRSVDWDKGGKGMLFQKGKGIPITWKEKGGWIIPLIDGKVASLLPGKSWVNVLPEEGKLTWK
ncbi:Protein of unknown function [Marininema mesophilum]|uniref:DUF3048 domain-containing protein n=1 Tax=Marininema mesophilum TaxID=1048340 RepID=A0A1H2YZB1_9BACL|nr:DUF3048 domain-containing protein [Marininema mesophilum]SDX09994.1 Protein of unknown function [Marininema mesophilum]